MIDENVLVQRRLTMNSTWLFKLHQNKAIRSRRNYAGQNSSCEGPEVRSNVIFFPESFPHLRIFSRHAHCALGWDTQSGIKIVEAIALLWQENGTLNLIYEGVYFFQKEDNWSSMIMNAKRRLGVGVI